MRVTQSTLSNNLAVALLPIRPPMERSNPNDRKLSWIICGLGSLDQPWTRDSRDIGICFSALRQDIQIGHNFGNSVRSYVMLSGVTRVNIDIRPILIAPGHVMIALCLSSMVWTQWSVRFTRASGLEKWALERSTVPAPLWSFMLCTEVDLCDSLPTRDLRTMPLCKAAGCCLLRGLDYQRAPSKHHLS